MLLDNAFITTVTPGINAVWNYIGSDAMEFCENNAQAIEMCIDADRLTSCVDRKDINDMVREAIKEHGYSKVHKFLTKNITLM